MKGGIRPGPPRIPLDRVRRIFLSNLVNKLKHKERQEQFRGSKQTRGKLGEIKSKLKATSFSLCTTRMFRKVYSSQKEGQ